MYISYLIFSYILGSISFAWIIAKVFKNIDIRKYGSKNPGATNVYRTISKPLGILTLILDVLKGFIPVYLVPYFWNLNIGKGIVVVNSVIYYTIIVALLVILGHVFSIFLNFKGGKGVAVGLGVFLAINPIATLCSLAVFIVIVVLTRYVSLSSIVASIVLPIGIYFFSKYNIIQSNSYEFLIFSIIVVLLVIIRHISNIKRLLNGTENKISGSKSSK